MYGPLSLVRPWFWPSGIYDRAAQQQTFAILMLPRLKNFWPLCVHVCTVGGKVGFYILAPIRILTTNKLENSRTFNSSGQLFVEYIPLRISYLNWNFWSTKCMNIAHKRNVLELLWCKKCFKNSLSKAILGNRGRLMDLNDIKLVQNEN